DSPSQPINSVSAHAAGKVPRNKTLSTETCPPGGHSLRSRHRRAAERLRHSGGWLERDLTRRSSECCDLNRTFLSQFRVWDSGRVEDLWNATLRCCKRQPRLGPRFCLRDGRPAPAWATCHQTWNIAELEHLGCTRICLYSAVDRQAGAQEPVCP